MKYRISVYRPQGKPQRQLISCRSNQRDACISAAMHSKFCKHQIVVDEDRADGQSQLIAKYLAGKLISEQQLARV
jgi:hypothetical protein